MFKINTNISQSNWLVVQYCVNISIATGINFSKLKCQSVSINNNNNDKRISLMHFYRCIKCNLKFRYMSIKIMNTYMINARTIILYQPTVSRTVVHLSGYSGLLK